MNVAQYYVLEVGFIFSDFTKMVEAEQVSQASLMAYMNLGNELPFLNI